MLWSASNTPYHPGSGLGEANIEAVGGVVKARNTEYALRRDNLDITSTVKEFNYNVLSLDTETILMERTYGRSDAFFYLGNFGKKTVERDWSGFSPSGGVVANTLLEGEREKVELKRVELEAGQGMVLRIKK